MSHPVFPLRWIARKVLLTALWLVYLVVLIQIAGWVYYAIGVSRPIESYGYPVGLFAPHDKLDYLFTPNFRGHFNGAAYQDIPIRINEHGFRDDPFGPKSPQRLRVVVLGDSVVFGAGLREELRFTELLQAHPPLGAPPLEVLNLGVNSYSFGHYLALAELDFMGLQPDAVIVGFTLNDNDPMERSWPASRFGQHADEAPPGVQAHVRQWLSRLAGARLLREARDRLRFALMNAHQQEAYHTQWMRAVTEGWRDPQTLARLGGEIVRFQALLKAQRRPYGFLVFPELNDVLHPEQFGTARNTLLAMLADLGVPTCDPYAAFAAAKSPQFLYLVQDSVHFSVAGQQMLRNALAACIADGRIPLRNPPGT